LTTARNITKFFRTLALPGFRTIWRHFYAAGRDDSMAVARRNPAGAGHALVLVAAANSVYPGFVCRRMRSEPVVAGGLLNWTGFRRRLQIWR